MDYETLVRRLGFCAGAEQTLLQTAAPAGPQAVQALCGAAAEEAEQALRAALAPDEDGMKMLACMLRAALHTRALYREKGIPEDIFWATAGFLPRFVNAHAALHGAPAFAWGWWFWRQLSLREFRIGALEYEMTEQGGKPAVSLHIPAGADLSATSLRASLRGAREFFAAFFPAFAGAEMVCSSWMLSPALPALLPPSSNVLAFGRLFTVTKWDEESSACLDWIFPRRDMPLEALAEDTSLQRAAKAFLRGGGKIGWADGVLTREP